MYTIKVDGIGLYAPNLANEGYSVLNPKITYELNKAGSLEFVVPPNNVNYNKIHKLKSIVQVFDDGVEIFRGRVLHDDTDFYKRKSVYCEGELAFLLDSIVRSYDYQGNFDGLFNQMIENHNSQVDDEKKFKIGQITVKDKNDYIHYSSTQYPNTWDEINEKLIKTHGGYLRVRLDDGERYIDYIEDYTNVSDQVIEFGKNMIDLSTYISADDVFTVLIPLGSQIKNESGETTGRVTIESVNDGKDYIQDDNAISIFGKIVKTQKWDNVSHPDNLLYKAHEYLESGVQMATTLTMKAVDLHLLDVNVESIKLGDYCRVLSIPHGIDRLFQCSKIQIDLTNPQNSVYTFGLNLKSMTDQQLSNNSDVKSIISNTNDSSKQELEQKITNAQQAMKNEMADAVNKISGGTNGHVVLAKNDDGETNELYAFDGESLFSSLKLLRLNYEGIAGTDKGYNGEYKLAISTDGKINAEQLVVGIIRDALGKNFWNLETGEFSILGYATDNDISNALSNANTYTNQQAQGALDTAKNYADSGDARTLGEAKTYAEKASALAIKAQTQDDIFNKLTNNGTVKGIILTDGKLYINADYITSGILNANLLRAGIIKSAKNENNYWNLDTGEFRLQAIDNMLVGGTNLVDGTMKDVYVSAGGNTEEHMVLYTSLEQDKPYVLSFEATSSNTNQITVRALIPNSGIYKDYTVEINNGRSYVFINAEDQATDLYLYCGLYGQTAWKTVKFHHIMLEKGTVASDWSPSPNDLMSTVAELSQEDIFNKLTNNGQTQGLYLQNGKIYLNLEYLVSKVIKGLSIFGSTITFGDDGATYRVQASYRESDTSYDGYKPKGVLFQTYHADASIQHVTDRFFVTYFSDKVHNPLQITRTQSILRAENSSGSVDAFFVATAKDDGPVANVTAIASDVMNTVSVTKKGIKLAVSYTGKYLFLDNSTGDLSYHSLGTDKNDYIFSSSGGNVTYKTYLNNFLQACDGSGNVKSYLHLYSNGQAWLSSDGQMVSISKGNSWVKSIGNDVYIQSRDSSDNSTNSYVYVQKDGKVQIGSSGNKNTIINGYPAVRINGTYHDIFFQWNGASLIATVDVTQVWSTSDRRLKDQIDTISDDYIDAIGSAEIKQFIFTDEIYDKSIKHFGVIAQDVREALEAKGINPEEIAVNNHFDRDGEEYYGIDKEEFLMARIAYDEKKIKELKNEISDLREQMNILTDLIKQKGE